MLNVILVDDEVVAVNALKRRVNWTKYGIENVYTANSMQQAQILFKTEKIDFMLCDIEMPQGNGLELYEWVKLYYPEVKCIYVSCHPEYEYIRKALQLGTADYLLKPIDYDELDKILVQLIERFNKQPDLEKIPENIIRTLAERESKEKQGDVVHQVKHYILMHIQENIYVEDIAEQVHLNAQYLMRLFKKETGSSILEYITDERLKLAKELLVKTEYPINKVADNVGYDNYSYFTKIFKRNMGVTPAIYRQNNKMGD